MAYEDVPEMWLQSQLDQDNVTSPFEFHLVESTGVLMALYVEPEIFITFLLCVLVQIRRTLTIPEIRVGQGMVAKP